MLLGEAINYVFGMESILIAAILPRQNAHTILYKYFLALFISIGISCFLWSIYIAGPLEEVWIHYLLRDMCLIVLGFTAMNVWFICVHLCFLNVNRKNTVVRLIKASYVIFIFIILLFNDDFFTLTLFYLPPTIFFTMLMLIKYYQTLQKRLLLGGIGAICTILGIGFDQLFECPGGHGTECVRNILFMASNSLAILLVFVAAQQLLSQEVKDKGICNM